MRHIIDEPIPIIIAYSVAVQVRYVPVVSTIKHFIKMIF